MVRIASVLLRTAKLRKHPHSLRPFEVEGSAVFQPRRSAKAITNMVFPSLRAHWPKTTRSAASEVLAC
ncbi:unnamed protein product [Haemonchus placei]|uniref:Uncharacterized protein n=1 Tax=Haemonchus placei TaxID=6290 RepID=A0A3P7TVD6_HAEPC|nr:unnamed protein product [Haemonchus placei]